MKNIPALLLLIALFACQNSYAQKGWYQQSGATTDTVWFSVALISAQTGTIVGQSGLMLRTTNGGNVWSFTNSAATQTLYKVRYYDQTLGIAVGNSGAIVRTSDGGATWTSINSGTTKALYDIYIKSPTEWIVVGNAGLIHRTTDAGGTWKDDSRGENNLWSIAFDSKKLLGYTVGNANTEYVTIDGGKNWDDVDMKAPTAVNGVAFLTDTTIVAVGLVGTLIYSPNAGKTWKQGMANVPLSQYQLMDVCAAGPNIGFAVGWAGMVLNTLDGGKNWTAQDGSVGYNLQGISFADAKTGNACGWSNTIIRTVTGGSLATGPIAALPAQPVLEQNYPNPFHRMEQTKITFTLPSAAQATVKVYNMLGAEIAVLYDGFLASGDHGLVWNAGSVPPGVYFYTLNAGGYSMTKQLVFLK
jgi:photosystem II stability/assembly factor-like uncharacterized protein